MSSPINFYYDRQEVSSLPSELSQELKRHYLIRPDDRSVTFTGMVIRESGINIFLPRNTSVDVSRRDISFRYASLLMKSLKVYLKSRKRKELDNGSEGCIGGTRFNIITSLLEDYCTYGLYSQRYREKVINSGKPDWRRTISSSTTYLGSSGPVYLNIYGIRQRYISNCKVARIHADVIRDLDQSYSWIITGSSIPIAKDIENIPSFVAEKNIKINILENELRFVYAERQIRLISFLIQYLKNTHSRSSTDLIGLRHFHYMWESMLDSSLKWVFPVNKLLAIPAYRFKDGLLVSAASKGQRTDTVLKSPDNRRFVVIDAKYYGAKDVINSPGWGDIVKQFFYAKALKIYAEGAEVDNAFIFPGDGPIRTVHMQDRDSEELLLDQDYPPIKCFYIEPMFLIEHYVSGKKLKILSNQLMFGNI